MTREESTSRDAAPDAALLEALAAAAAAFTGFSREAILPDPLARTARELLSIWQRDELFARIKRGDERVLLALAQAVSVAETFFFRHPEQFRFIEDVLAPRWIARHSEIVRIWSAGCATGEEAYSLAATLQQALSSAPQIRIDVLATDLAPRNLALAQAATYGAWSQRESAPIRAPLFEAQDAQPARNKFVRVLESVRGVVRFAEHNLLAPLDESPFDLILCRNVLVYFSPAAAERALDGLMRQLAPDGVMMFGSMDLHAAPQALMHEGPAESLIFRRRPEPPTSVPRRTNPDATPQSESPLAPEVKTNARVVNEVHLRALMQLESRELVQAEQSLRALLALAPDYLPGLLERALLHARRGEPAAATALMREVHRRARALAPEADVAGPQTLPARFYLESAEAFLRSAGGRG